MSPMSLHYQKEVCTLKLGLMSSTWYFGWYTLALSSTWYTLATPKNISKGPREITLQITACGA